MAIIKGELTRLIELFTPKPGSLITQNPPTTTDVPALSRSSIGQASEEDIPNGQRRSSSPFLLTCTPRKDTRTQVNNNSASFNFIPASRNNEEDIYLISGAKPKRQPPEKTYGAKIKSSAHINSKTSGTVHYKPAKGPYDNLSHYNVEKLLKMPFDFDNSNNANSKGQVTHDYYNSLKQMIFGFGNKLTKIKHCKLKICIYGDA
ncbi:uncharacterized protein LOC122788870 [Protopterus annectens]|uniref:uncharacterized protein LOC122788870 n=1 Tax=Protopterus annectens TaxID=7888 RepID=UPI001CFA0E96|nr:uncharacterized protein LOC122788870 [Protopterus annectens]